MFWDVMPFHFFMDCKPLKMQAVHSSEKSVTIYQLVQCNIPEDLNLFQCCFENLNLTTEKPWKATKTCVPILQPWIKPIWSYVTPFQPWNEPTVPAMNWTHHMPQCPSHDLHPLSCATMSQSWPAPTIVCHNVPAMNWTHRHVSHCPSHELNPSCATMSQAWTEPTVMFHTVPAIEWTHSVIHHTVPAIISIIVRYRNIRMFQKNKVTAYLM
jgi:hypothetical protein